METPTLPPKPTNDYSSFVDTSSPFRSVKEAVAIFGERILVGEIYSPRPYYTPPRENTTSWRFFSPSPSPIKKPKDDDHDHDHEQNVAVLGTLQKLEAELKETKAELKLLKERESETEITLASLNAELHKSMSKLAEAEAAAAKKAVAAAKTAVGFEREKREDVLREEEKRKELLKRMENSPTLSQILALGEENGYFGGNTKAKKVVKKKPIVPLLGDLFFRKKRSSKNALNNPLYGSNEVYFK